MTEKPEEKIEKEDAVEDVDNAESKKKPKEIGGPSGPEPTRYGDWERNGIVSDF